MRHVGLVGQLVFKESVRDRVLFAMAGFAVLLVAAAVLIGQISAGQDARIITDLGLAAIELSGVLMAVFIGVGLVAREIERRSVHVVLAKPLRRHDFILGKFLGLAATLSINVAGMAVALILVRWWWSMPAVDQGLVKALLLIQAEVLLVTTVALLVSTFSSSGVMSAILTLGVWVVGLLSQDLRGFTSAEASTALTTVVQTVGWILPAFSDFDVKAEVVNGRPVPWAYVGLTLAYAWCYMAGLLAGAAAIFSRREFT